MGFVLKCYLLILGFLTILYDYSQESFIFSISLKNYTDICYQWSLIEAIEIKKLKEQVKIIPDTKS